MIISGKTKLIFVPIFFCFLLILSSKLLAQNVKGEIININNTQHLIFVDLGSDLISQGDVFVVDGLNKRVYLEVVDVKNAVSKLTLSQKENFKSILNDFDLLSVGLTVTMVLKSKDQPAVTSSNVNSLSPLLPDVSNEINQPMSVIIAALDVLKEKVNNDIPEDSRHEFLSILKTINKQADSLIGLTENLAKLGLDNSKHYKNFK